MAIHLKQSTSLLLLYPRATTISLIRQMPSLCTAKITKETMMMMMMMIMMMVTELLTAWLLKSNRVSHSTFYDERNRLEANHGLQAWENSQPVYTQLEAESEEFRKWLPKSSEQFQLLHHVAIRNHTKGLILVGNKDKVIFGVFVDYKQETIDAYKEVLEEIYNHALSLFYETDPLKISKKKIEEIIKCKELNMLD